ncbi:hypothetical protein I553_4321 [Mycobacterium xenopi 4042]|uniref:Uncharacterized protein n=1 Tax=Mycobacterium xenopi 4042 TaxID=1299334 RepID=X8AGS0_MYCXE|nr:hypothetical protein I553_4321 [Mycobacterium xenopi 4042]EUA50753.1 hypothetical protein I552_1693 [Mycobacterium xenopi 3993]
MDLREALEQIGQDVMAGTSPRRALSELLRRGTRNMPGPTGWQPRRTDVDVSCCGATT